MKTTVTYITLKEVDCFGRECNRSWKRIQTGSGDLMENRIIQIFSQWPKERIGYEVSLELEVFQSYYAQLEDGMRATFIAQDEQVESEFLDAVFGRSRDPKELYVAFAKGHMADIADELARQPHSELTLQLQATSTRMMLNIYRSGVILIEQMLRAKRRLKRFNVHNHPVVEKFSYLPRELAREELTKRARACNKRAWW